MYSFHLPALCTGLACATAGFAIAQAPQARPVIAVLPADLVVGEDTLLSAESASSMVARNLDATGLFTSVERARIAEVIRESKIQNSGLVKDETAVAMGKLLGARFVVLISGSASAAKSEEVTKSLTGLSIFSSVLSAVAATQGGAAQPAGQASQVTVATHTVWKSHYSLEVRVVDVESGAIQQRMTAKGEGTAKNSIESGSQALAHLDESLRQGFMEAYPLSAKVIEAKGPKRLVIDAGLKRGVRVGDTFALMTRAQSRIHPVTGATIQGEKILLARFEVKEVDTDISTLKRLGSGPDQILPDYMLERTGAAGNAGGSEAAGSGGAAVGGWWGIPISVSKFNGDLGKDYAQGSSPSYGIGLQYAFPLGGGHVLAPRLEYSRGSHHRDGYWINYYVYEGWFKNTWTSFTGGLDYRYYLSGQPRSGWHLGLGAGWDSVKLERSFEYIDSESDNAHCTYLAGMVGYTPLDWLDIEFRLKKSSPDFGQGSVHETRQTLAVEFQF